MALTVEMTVEDILGPHGQEVVRMSRDIRAASGTMGPSEARFLVDAYYIMQEDRKRTFNQERAMGSEPHVVISWLAEKNQLLEKQIAAALGKYVDGHKMGDWLYGVVGIGPVLAAGLLAHIYVGYWCAECRAQGATEAERRKECARRQERAQRPVAAHEYREEVSCPTTGHIWQFAGLAGSGQRPWEKGARRPFNAQLKTLCWKVGQSFMKQSFREECFYGRVYRERKALEVERNEAGLFAEQAAASLPRFSKTTEAYKHYAAGRLSPAHIDARARRYAVKMFLSAFHDEWYRREFGREPPLPYPVAHLGHAHVVAPPGVRPRMQREP